jgi:3'-5' exoribonuclease
MTFPPDLSRLIPGDRVQDSFLVLEVETRTGDHPHTVLTLGNSTGSISTAPFWAEDEPRIAGIGRRAVVQVTGEVVTYRERPQLKVTSIRVLPKGAVETSRLLPSVGSVEPYWACLDRLRNDIRGPRLRAVLDLFYQDPDFRRRYQECPASAGGHHGEIGGLLKHTSEVAAIAVAIAKSAGADVDLVVTGALLHDIGKLEAYRWEASFEPTDLNALHGHVVLGAMMLDRAVRACPTPPCTDRELSILIHLVLSHHGRREFGAPVPPLTLEAEVLHHADNASAGTASMAQAIRRAQNFAPGGQVSSSALWQVDRRRVYRGSSDWGRLPESASAELGASESPRA